jgi:hypothetical protein
VLRFFECVVVRFCPLAGPPPQVRPGAKSKILQLIYQLLHGDLGKREEAESHGVRCGDGPAAAFAGIACAVLSCSLITAITFNLVLHRIF